METRALAASDGDLVAARAAPQESPQRTDAARELVARYPGELSYEEACALMDRAADPARN